ncbi:hypothetical protein [Embleya sp. NPDC059237]|uniref:hypothetical protein n=1 Tax=Embleya sp. NPDC059237 TaxID=3346784 RepID=UPI0036ABE2D8
MVAKAGAHGREPLDQVVYRWSHADLLGRKGMGPVAGSLNADRLKEWDHGLYSHVSMDRSPAETPAWSVSRVSLEDWHALILRESTTYDGNRPGNNAHVLLDPERRVDGHTMLAVAWLHGQREGGLVGYRLGDAPGRRWMYPASIRPDAFDPDLPTPIREQARHHADLVEIVLAAVLRNHRRQFTLHMNDVGPDVVPLLWGVFDLAQHVAPGQWTFSTYETSDAAVKPRFVLVPRWPNAPEPANRLRIDFGTEPRPGHDVFRDAAGILVREYCTRPWEDVRHLLVKVGEAIPPGASFLDRANLLCELDPVPRENPAGGRGEPGAPDPGRGSTHPGGAPASWSGPGRPAPPADPPRTAEEHPARSVQGRWNWDAWDRLGATAEGLTALRKATEPMAQGGGRETQRVGREIERADPGTLAAALLLLESPLLEAVIRRLAVLVDREYANPRREWRSLRAYAEVLGRLHEGIATLADCGVQDELLYTLLGKMTRMVAENGDRFPCFAADVAGTITQLRRSNGRWQRCQRVLVEAISTTASYPQFQRECGRLLIEEYGVTPYGTGSQP